MNWSDFYLICFLFGFGLSVLSLLAGSTHLHIPHFHVHHGIHIGDHGSAPWFNAGTIAAFLAWFGGVGYLLTHIYHVWVVVVVCVAALSGLGAAAIVFWFLAKVLMADEAPLDPADYDMIGVLGHTTIPIRAGGTGELLFTQGGTRHVTGARSESGAAIAKGTEVIVTRYEKGIAYVRPFEDVLAEEEPKGQVARELSRPEEQH